MNVRAHPESVVVELVGALAELAPDDERQSILESKQLIEAVAKVSDADAAQEMFRELIAHADRD